VCPGHAKRRAHANPRQVSAYQYPSQYGRRSPNFSRAALTRFGQQWVLLISGTASIVGHESLHAGDVRTQTREILVNLGVLVQEANPSAGSAIFALDELVCTVYVRHSSDLDPVRSEMASVLGEHSIACHEAVFLQADICRNELVVEIEATGVGQS
jgi:enamine deaminase RidA (YjgF/YER057c/UK114 family)